MTDWLRPSLETYLAALRAVDGGFESKTDGWSLTTTSDIAATLGVSRQRVTPVLHLLAKEGFIHSCQQTDGSVTWHRYDRAVKYLRAENEIVVQHGHGPLRRASHPVQLAS
jgi:Mn-dependent DtxR family transcriptional regulator